MAVVVRANSTSLAEPAQRTVSIAVLAGGIVVALGLTLLAPLVLAVLGLIAFGVLHNVTELRALAQRYAGSLLRGRTMVLVISAIGGICALRGLALANVLTIQQAWRGEIVLLWSLLALAVGSASHLAAIPRAVLGTLLIPLAVLSWRAPEWHFVILTHLHNLLPALFLLEWTRGQPGGGPRVALTLTWTLVIPALLLSGAIDLPLSASGLPLASPERYIATLTPPIWRETALAPRVLALFAFQQTMHYVYWLLLLPPLLPPSVNPHPVARATRDWRYWPLGLGVALCIGLLLWSDFEGGRRFYAMLAAVHAYVEFPILLLLLAHPVNLSESKA